MLERKASPAGHSCSSLELKTRLTGFPFLSLFFFFFFFFLAVVYMWLFGCFIP